ncbi:zinc-ribbon domain containing protein [Sinobacterium caligoides]|nr:zinc-ribbon domain containing protein [Sinobacterium caligoides]
MDKKSKNKLRKKAAAAELRKNIEPMDKVNWSDSSKNSYAYESPVRNAYIDSAYRCTKCHQVAVFSAKAQKYTYEVKKSYICQYRTLCPECYYSLKNLVNMVNGFEELWAKENESTKHTAPYIIEWLDALQQFPKYGKKANQAIINMLNNHISKNS